MKRTATNNQFRRTSTSGALIAATLFATPALADCKVWQAYGEGIGSLGGFNPVVRSLGVYNGDLIAGGQFDNAGGQPANRIVRWNESTGNWEQIGSGVAGGSFPTVHAITVYNGELIIAGTFTHSGNLQTELNRVARWDEASQTWQPLGTGVNDAVFALAVYNGELIVGGDLTNAGGVAVGRIARWDGSQWHALGAPGSGVSGANPPWVMSLTVYNDELVVGGWFTQAGGISANRIVRWNGSTWATLGLGMNEIVEGVTTFGNNLAAVGGFTMAGGSPASRVAMWNGSQWLALGSGVNDWAFDAIEYSGDLFVSGSFSTAGGVTVNRLGRWNSNTGLWEDVGGGVNNLTWTFTLHDDSLVVGGWFTMAGDTPANRVASWKDCIDAPCPGDLTGDGSVGVADLLELLAAWGPNPGHPADLTGDGNVGVADLLALLAAWGPCP